GVSSSTKSSLLNAATASARTAAKTYAGYNTAAEVSSLTLLDGDVEFGFTDTSGNYTPLSSYGGYPNTAKGGMRRDASRNRALPMVFAKVLGMSTLDLSVTASACIYAGQIDGFKTNTQAKSRILPMTYDVNDWNSFLRGDVLTWLSVSYDSDGLPRLSVYP